MKLHRLSIFPALFFAAVGPAIAQPNLCGSAPVVEDFRAKADLHGKVGLISKYLGDAGLKGQVEIAKNDVLQKYPNSDATRLKEKFLHMVCLIIVNDSNVSLGEKLDRLERVRRGIFTPKSDLEDLYEKHSYIERHELYDKLLAASAIIADSCDNRTIWTADMLQAFHFKRGIFESTLRKLKTEGMATKLRKDPELGGIFAYQLTDKAYDYVEKKKLIRRETASAK